MPRYIRFSRKIGKNILFHQNSGKGTGKRSRSHQYIDNDILIMAGKDRMLNPRSDNTEISGLHFIFHIIQINRNLSIHTVDDLNEFKSMQKGRAIAQVIKTNRHLIVRFKKSSSFSTLPMMDGASSGIPAIPSFRYFRTSSSQFFTGLSQTSGSFRYNSLYKHSSRPSFLNP